MPSYSCSSSRHLPTRVLQICFLRSLFIDTTTLILGSTHCCSSIIKYLSPRDHITPTMKQLHWLSTHARIAFKISLLIYHIHSGTSPSYMSSMVTQCHPMSSMVTQCSASRSRGLSPKASGRYRTTPTDLGCGHQNPLTLPSPELRLKWVIGPFGSLAHAPGTIFLDQFRQPRLFLRSRNS